jgi:hypothetical protein
MPLSFLNPWLWLGALALAVPVWLHLRRRQEKNLFYFSALRFLEDEPQPRRGPLTLQDLLLFLVRALALLLVVGAFAWPYLRGPDTVPVRESRVYILDNTLSHQAGNGFARDRDRIADEIDRAGMDIQCAVVEITATPRTLVAFSDPHGEAVEKVKSLRPGFQRGSYLAAFRQANSLLANSLGVNRRIVFLGDNQENQWTENASSPPFLRGATIDSPKPPAPGLPNFSLSEPRAQRIFLGDKSLVHFTAKLVHPPGAKSARITLRSNGQLILNRALELGEKAEAIMIQAQWESDPAAWVRAEAAVEAEPDALSADDRLFFTLAPVLEGTVALLAQSAYLRLALSADVMRGQWAARLIEPSRIADEANFEALADVLCIESNYLQSGDARRLLARYLEKGRGVLLLVNRLTPAIKACLREYGFEADYPAGSRAETEEKFQFVFSNHPIFHPFISPDYGNLMEIRVARHAHLRAPDAMPLIFGENGAPFFFEKGLSSGKLFVAAFGLDREHTSWPIHQTFIPFLDLTLQAARAEDPFPSTFEPGEMALVPVPVASAAKEYSVRDGETELGRVPVEQWKIRLRVPEKPGVYTLVSDDAKQADRLFAVNPSPKESQLVYADPSVTLAAWKSDAQPANAPEVGVLSAQVSLAAILQQRYWWWMVVAGLSLLLAEMVLAALNRKQRV